jgi:hypothetical protein
MKRFIEGKARTQVTLLPECLHDYVAEENPVRVVDVYIDELDMGALGFEGVDPAATGRPAYHPCVFSHSLGRLRPVTKGSNRPRLCKNALVVS